MLEHDGWQENAHADFSEVKVGTQYEGVDKIAKFKCLVIVFSSD